MAVSTIKGLLVWLPLIKDLSNQGLAKVSITNNGATYSSTGGKLGGCYSFNGNCIGILNLPITQDISIAFWMKPSNTSKTRCLLNYRTSIGSDLAIFLIGGNIRFDAGGLTTFSDYIFTTNWQHVCVVKEGSTKKLYIDGLLKQTVTGVGNVSCTATKGTIGLSSTNTINGAGNAYIGLLNDYRYYSYALSPQEIKEISRGLVGHWSGNDPWVEETTNLATQLNWEVISGSVWGGHTSTSSNVDLTNEHIPPITGTKLTITYSGSGGGGVNRRCGNYTVKPNTKYTMSMYIKATDDLLYWHLNFLYFYGDANGRGIAYSINKEKVFGDWYRIWGTFTTGASLTSILPYFYSYPVKEITYYLAGLQLEEKDHMTAYVKDSRQAFLSDISGRHLDLEAKGSGITLNTNTPRYDKCLSFDGNGYLETNNLNINSSEPHTLSFWFYPKANGLMICSFNNRLNLYTSGNYISLNNGDGTGNRFGNWLFTLNTWYHIAITFNGSTARLYVNGEDKGTTPIYRPLNGPKMIIGAYINGTNYRYTGMLSDIRLYATALDTTAIQELKALGH